MLDIGLGYACVPSNRTNKEVGAFQNINEMTTCQITQQEQGLDLPLEFGFTWMAHRFRFLHNKGYEADECKSWYVICAVYAAPSTLCFHKKIARPIVGSGEIFSVIFWGLG